MIFYFSGTGNSHWIAKQLSAKLNDNRVVSISDAINDNNFRFTIEEGEKIGWVFPIYSWGPAPIVIDFIGKMHIDGYNIDRTYCYMVCTCGDDIGLAADVWRKALGRIKGNAAFSVQMPNNYILMPGFDVDSDENAQRKIDNAPTRIDEIVTRIMQCRDGDDVVHGGWKWIKTKWIYPFFKRFAMSDKSFRVDASKCNSCGKCWKSCPINNIKPTQNNTPQWQQNCAMCLNCIHICPSRAIQYSNQSQKKGRYRIAKYVK